MAANRRSLEFIRRKSSGFDKYLDLVAYSPAWLYAADPDYMIRDGSDGVSNWADVMDPLTANSDYVQATVPNRPVYLAVGSAPSGAPCVQADGISDYLANLLGTSGLRLRCQTGDKTWYTGCYVGSVGGVEHVDGSDSTTTGQAGRSRLNGNQPQAQSSTTDNAGGGLGTGNVAFWVGGEYLASGPTLKCLFSGGDGAGAAVVARTALDSSSLFAFANAGVYTNYWDGEIYLSVGFNRILSAGDKSAVESIISEIIGI